jgi:hypothetical protein
MKHLPSRHLAVFAAAFAAVLGLAVLAAPAAHAFTIDDRSNTNADGSARYTDPDARFSGSGSNGKTTIRQGNTTLQFGQPQQSFDQRYNPSRMFDPLGRPGDPGR